MARDWKKIMESVGGGMTTSGTTTSNSKGTRDWNSIMQSINPQPKKVTIGNSTKKVELPSPFSKEKLDKYGIAPDFAKKHPTLSKGMMKVADIVGAPLKIKAFDRTVSAASNAFSMNPKNAELVDTGNKALNIGADFIGTGLGYGMNAPGMVAGSSLQKGMDAIGKPVERAAGKVVTKSPKVIKKLAPTMARGAAEFGALGGTEAALSGEDLRGIAKATGKSALQGAAFNGSIKGTREGLKQIGKGINKIKTEKPIEVHTSETKLGVKKGTGTKKTPEMIKKSNELNDYYNNIDGMDYINKFDPEYVKAENAYRAKKGLPPLNDSVEPILQLPRVEIKKTPKIEVPKLAMEEAAAATAPKLPPKIEIPKLKNKVIGLPKLEPILTKETKTSNMYFKTLKNTPLLPNEVKNIIDESDYIYGVQHNADQLARAEQRLSKNGLESEMNRLRSTAQLIGDDTMSHVLITKQLTAEGAKTGNYTKLTNWLKETRPKYTTAGQAIQALNQFKKSTPEGALVNANNIIEGVKDDLKKTNPKLLEKVEKEIKVLPKDNMAEFEKAKQKILEKNNIPTLTNAENKFIYDTMTKAQTLTGREKDKLVAQVMQLISDKLPASMQEKVKGLQRISLLLNPKTNVRNVLGNTILNTIENTKDLIGTPLDIGISKFTGKRTTMLPNLKTQGKGMLQGIKETVEDAKLGIDTSDVRGQYELPQGRTFKNNTLNTLDKATKVALQFGDRPFYKAAYNDRLNQLMKLAKAKEPTEEMMEQAIEYAKDRTLQNDSNIAKGMKELQKGLNRLTGNKNFGIGNFAVPFTKTPGNILDKAIDYSPLVLTKSMKQLSNISKGTFNQKLFVDQLARGITGTAAIMLGYDLAEKGYLTGKGNKDKDVATLERQAGKTPYSIKAGNTYHEVSWAQPLIIPLMIGADIYNEGKNRKEASSIVAEAIKSGGETLFKQSLLQGVQKLFGGYTPLQGVGDIIQSVPSQFTPSLLKQGSQLLDKNQRNTYDPSKFNQTINTVKAKLPELSKTLQPKIDTLGREVQINQGKNTPFNILINPGTSTKYKPTDAEKLILDIYDKTGETTIFPRVAPTSINGRPLTAQQVTDLQREMGTKTLEYLSNMANNQFFINLPLDKQVKAIERKLTDIQKEAKQKILPKDFLK